MFKKIAIILITLFFISAVLIFLLVRSLLFSPNTNSAEMLLHVPNGASFDQMMDSMNRHQILINENKFLRVAGLMKFTVPKAGKYQIKPETDNITLVRLLRRGQHYPVVFTFNNVRTIDQFIERVDHKFLFDPDDLTVLFHDENFLAQYGWTFQTVSALLIPDTYEIFYDITASDFFEKMNDIYEKFWNEQRRNRATEIGLTPLEVATLASIVEEESHTSSEHATIAGLYINRLKQGMMLQADPTVKFALGDFTIKRVLFKHLEVESPYNTYRYSGLPPGPIRVPSPATLDAVLYYEQHHYLYMCAKEDFSGMHNFAVTSAEHAKNAKKYHQALDKKNN